MEIVWETGSDQPEYLFGRLQPDGSVDGGIRIPGLDSFLAGFSRDTVVKGLTEAPAADRPSIREANITHFAFDTMVGVGTVLLGLAFWFGIAWVRRRDMPRSRWFYRSAALAGVVSVVGMEAGWITAEVGRQPWVVYNEMKVAEAVTDIGAGPIWTSFAVVIVIYTLVVWAFLSVLLRMKLRWRQADAETARVGAAADIPQQTAQRDEVAP
jgi:cytochrome d ubiquinol oxidase subunit I